MNSLADEELIIKLYEASKAGVKIKIIVRGICALKLGIRGLSENIEIISIIDKFLEHSRVYIFENDENPLYYISSADWMSRNLDVRIEVSVKFSIKKFKKSYAICWIFNGATPLRHENYFFHRLLLLLLKNQSELKLESTTI